MRIKKIKQNNKDVFLEDIKRVSEVMVYTHYTNSYFHITKKEVLEAAQEREIDYRITDKIFKVKRDVMVII